MSADQAPPILLLALGAALSPATADALPRFAARNGMECIQCHINPSGGGIRNAYGSTVFEKVWLPLTSRTESWLTPDIEEEEEEAAELADPAFFSSFSGRLTEWFSVGADVRTAYIYIRPDEPGEEGAPRDITSSFFLMQADLYHAAELSSYVTLVFDVGIYAGFEAWGLISPIPDPGLFDLKLRVGRFMPAFGIREVEHQLFTREGVGFGATDRDTGVELTTYLGPLTAHIALLNGTIGDTAFDASGTMRRTFEKGVSTRLSLRANLGALRAQIGGSFYFNENVNQPNPLFTGVLPLNLVAMTSEGLNELRYGGFLTANLGRFTYLGDLVVVRDSFYTEGIDGLIGHAAYQELSFVPTQGIELVATHEFRDPDGDIAGNSSQRAALVVEVFPWPFTELRAMVRRQWNRREDEVDTTDVVLFLHLFM